MTKVAAIDPGGTTGYALVEVTINGKSVPKFKTLRGLEITTFETFQNTFEADLIEYRPTVIVERFNLFPDKAQGQIGSSFPSAEWIGIVKYVMWSTILEVPVFQTSAQKAMITDLMLRERYEIDKLTSSPHIRDAMRHIVYWGLNQVYG